MVGASRAGTASPLARLCRGARDGRPTEPYPRGLKVVCHGAASILQSISRFGPRQVVVGRVRANSVQPNFQEVDRSAVAAFDAVGQSIPLGPRLPAGLEPLVNLARLLARQVARGWLTEGAVPSRMTAGSKAEENSGTWGTSSSSAGTPIPPDASDPSQGPLPIGIPLSGRPKRRRRTEG